MHNLIFFFCLIKPSVAIIHHNNGRIVRDKQTTESEQNTITMPQTSTRK